MITGKTRIFVIVAHPSDHLRTPQALNAKFAEADIDAVLVPADVAPEALERFVDGIKRAANLGGIVVTVPHKAAMLPLCDRVTARAAAAGAVNVIRREADGTLSGDALDGAGFVAGLKAAGHAVTGRRVYIVGAGGAAGAIAMAIAEEAPQRVTLVNRSQEKLTTLAQRLRERFPALDLSIGGKVGEHDLVINATSLGLHPGDALPIDPNELSPHSIVAEVVMQPERTALLQAAEARGCTIHNGRAMLEGQLQEMLAFLTRP